MAEEENNVAAGEPTPFKTPKRRSPNYPMIGLEKALDRAQTIQVQARHHFMPISVAYTAWNYKRGAGNQTVAALRAFGLIETQGEAEARQIRLTDMAKRILGNAPDRAELLKVAALKPDLHKDIWDKYEADPPADPIIREYLVWERNFNEDFVDSFIAQFRGTIAYAKLDLSDKIRGEDEDEGEEGGMPLFDTPDAGTPRAKQPPPPPPGYKDFPLYLTNNLKGTLHVPAEINLKDYKLLKQQIKNHLEIIRITSDLDEVEDEGKGGTE
jgi:hypothetical protein